MAGALRCTVVHDSIWFGAISLAQTTYLLRGCAPNCTALLSPCLCLGFCQGTRSDSALGNATRRVAVQSVPRRRDELCWLRVVVVVTSRLEGAGWGYV